MKLLSKLTLFITLSKLAVVLLFVAVIPYLIEKIAFDYTNSYLQEQKKKVLDVVAKNGVEFYLQGEDSYGSYTMLKEEYIALEPVTYDLILDTIQTSQRIVEQDTLNYRVLSYIFEDGNNKYLLEIGKTTATISQYNRPLQRIALYVLISLVLITIVTDLLFTHSLLKPLGAIIRTKLINQKFPFDEDVSPIKTSTSDFKYLDNSLIALMRQINEAFEKEREFTANASHELMTPISILQNKIENLMLHEGVEEAVQERLVDMMRTLNRLKKIVHALLMISRIENAQFAKTDTLNIKELFDEMIAEMEDRLEEKEISWSLDISPDVHLNSVNRDLLFQLFCNFINNGIKYNKYQGVLKIRDERLADKPYAIYIEDSGIGISEEELPLIFNRFKKANLFEGGGFGLGLSIVKSIADFHGIEICVTSQINKGTSFKIIFPDNMILKSEQFLSVRE